MRLTTSLSNYQASYTLAL